MRVCILYAPATKGDTRLKAIAGALGEGVSGQGHQVDMYDMTLEDRRIVSFYDYLIVGTDAVNFFGGKIPPIVAAFLKTAGAVSGKRSLAFISHGGVRSMKTLQVLMRVMEGEGMYLKKSEIITKPDMARAIGKHLHIQV